MLLACFPLEAMADQPTGFSPPDSVPTSTELGCSTWTSSDAPGGNRGLGSAPGAASGPHRALPAHGVGDSAHVEPPAFVHALQDAQEFDDELESDSDIASAALCCRKPRDWKRPCTEEGAADGKGAP